MVQVKVVEIDKPHMQNLEVVGRVVEKTPSANYNGKLYCKATIEDDTGKVQVNLWREQVNQLQVGDQVRIPNAFSHRKGKSLQISTWSDIVVIGESCAL